MRHRLIYILAVGAVILPALAGALWHPSIAYAAGEDYVFYNDSPETVYARNGVFKDSGLAIFTSTTTQDPNIPAGLQSTYNSIIKNPSANFNDGTYVGTYTCKTATIYALIGLTQGIGGGTGSDKGALYILGSSGGALSGSATHSASWVASNGCAPASANTKGYTGSPATIPIPLYSGLSTADGNDWHTFLTSHGQNVKDPGTAKLDSTPSGDGDAGPGADTPQCETSGFAFSWFFCQVINGLAGACHDLYNDFIQPFLETKPINVGNPQQDPTHTYDIWKNFRLYGDVFLVIALLVIVFGESIGGGLIDAYTAKKVLPRILVAAILINISIYLIAFAVDITNLIGNGIGELIEQPFKAAGDFQLKVGGGTASFGLGIVTAGGLWAVASGGALLEFLLVFFLIPAFLALLAVLITIVVRMGLIIFLVIISPVAFALYCLPNTEQYFRKWWDLLFRTLLIYPIIAVLFALANVLSITISSAAGGGIQQPIAQLIGVIALFVPLFLIPYSFRIAGGMIGKLHEVATSARQRSQEAIKGNPNDQGSWRNKVRRNLAARNAEHNISGAGLVAQIPRMGDLRNPGGWNRQRRARLAAARNMYQAKYGKEGAGYAMYEVNSQDSNVTGDLAKYATGAESRAAIQRQYEEEINSGVDRQTADRNREQRLFSSAAADKIGRTPSMRRMALMNPATIGYEIDGGAAGWDQATGIMRDIAGNDEGTYRSMVNEFQYVAKTAAGRPDLSRATDGKEETLAQAWGTGQIYGLGSVKPRAIQSFGKEFMQQYRDASAGPITEEAQGKIVDAGRFYLEQDAIIKGGATGAARDAALENIQKFRDAGIENVLNTDAFHSARTKQVQVRDPGTGKVEIKTVPFTMRDLAKEGMRSYDREAERNNAETP